MRHFALREKIGMAAAGGSVLLLTLGGWLYGHPYGATAGPLVPLDARGVPAATETISVGAENGGSGAGKLPSAAPSPSPRAAAGIVVYVTGAVKKPGLYTLKSGERAVQAVRAAGGFTADAQKDGVNLAALLKDSDQVYVPTQAEMVSSSSHRARGGGGKGTRGSGKERGGAGHGIVKLKTAGEGTVDLNTADLTELQRLPGVGPAMAQRILDYRQQIGRFTDTSQIQDIKGIGPKKYDKVLPFLRVS